MFIFLLGGVDFFLPLSLSSGEVAVDVDVAAVLEKGHHVLLSEVGTLADKPRVRRIAS